MRIKQYSIYIQDNHIKISIELNQKSKEERFDFNSDIEILSCENSEGEILDYLQENNSILISSTEYFYAIKVSYTLAFLFIGLPEKNILYPHALFDIGVLNLKVRNREGVYTNYNGKKNIGELRDLVVKEIDREHDYTLVEVRQDSVNVDVKRSKATLKKELQLVLQYCNKVFGKVEDFTVIISSYPYALGASYKNIIFISEKLSNNQTTMLYKYLIHEIIHQVIGNEMKFSGKGYLLLLESLTEFLQLMYLKSRFSEGIYVNIRNQYVQNAKQNNPIYEVLSDLDKEEYFKKYICGKGILLWEKIFLDTEKIDEFINELRKIRQAITISHISKILLKMFNLDFELFIEEEFAE